MRAFVAGGAGFIGSHTVDRLLRMPNVKHVTVFDDFSSGKRVYLPSSKRRLRVIRGKIGNLRSLRAAMEKHDVVFHFASNADISKAVRDPAVDFRQGTLLTQNIAEAVRLTGVRQIIYASGSGVYGDHGHTELNEDYAPMLPVSTYGASKLAGESLLCAYAHMFGIQSWIFRFGNVVGPRQTHGVLLDFLKKLRVNSDHLSILGNGKQRKSYVHVDDVLDAVWLAWQRAGGCFNYFNVATDDTITVRKIATLAACALGVNGVRFEYAGGTKGWAGDIPVVRLNSSKMKKLGWRAVRNSSEAIEEAAEVLVRDLDECHL